MLEAQDEEWFTFLVLLKGPSSMTPWEAMMVNVIHDDAPDSDEATIHMDIPGLCN